MQKNYNTLWMFIILLALFTNKASGQLTGNYTIDDTQLSSATNFTSFTQFASTLNLQGVAAGGATVSVNGSPVYTEQINLANTSMTSANRLYIVGNGRTLTYAAQTTNLPHTLLLSGADYVTISNLKIDATNATNALAVHLWNGADYNTFNTCTITCVNNLVAPNLIPLSVSNSSTSTTVTGNSGNYNTWDGCLISGGYSGVIMTGLSTSPFSLSNKIINGRIIDFYYIGVYMYGYQADFEVRNNVFERLTRTAVLSPCYGVYLSTSPLRNKIEKNHFRRMYDNMTSTTAGFAGVYIVASATPGNEIIIRNNVISDIKSNGYIYGIYAGASTNVFIDNNTISIDDQSGTSTGANTVYGIYATAAPARMMNNLISITRSGPGTKYGLYYATITTFTSNGNVVYTTNGANFGYITAARSNLAAWRANSPYDVVGAEVDPIYTGPGFNYVPTNTVINNMAVPIGLVDDKSSTQRSAAWPDPGAYEMYTAPCFAAPSNGSVTGVTTPICPGMSVTLQVPGNGFLFSGYTLQWQASTLAIAGYTSVPGATIATNSFNPPQTTYYTALITCTITSASAQAIPMAITVIAPSSSVIPYKESFETLAINQLPNCGWSASSSSAGIANGNTITYTTSSTNGRYPRTGKNFASFYYTPAGQYYFYTNAIQLDAGVTYSASMWYITEATGATNFTDLSILVGTGQTPLAQTHTIVSTKGPAQSVIYKQLTDTFRVSASGLYYVSVRATAIAGNAQYLSWDDLEITIPCQYNGPPMVVGTTASSVICSGQVINLNAAGASSYTWSTGQNGSAITAVAPNVLNPSSYNFSVTGLNAVSGCTSTLAQNFLVNPSPLVYAVSNNPAFCQGQSAVLTALGASNYVWAHGTMGPVTTVAPLVTTTYSVNGVNSYGCIGTGTVQVVVGQVPGISVSANSTVICAGEELQLKATGGTSYNWINSNGGVFSGPNVNIHAQSSAVYTVTGSDPNGCSNTAKITIAVNECTGLAENSLQNIQIFPNPVNDVLNIRLTGENGYTLKLMDVTGKIIYTEAAMGNSEMNLSEINAGVYSLMITNERESKTVKIVKMN